MVYLRFALAQDNSTPLPRSFVTHYGRFERITLTALDADGAERLLDYPMDKVQRINAGPIISAALPDVTPQTAFIVARIERP